ncbi:DUF3923 family protein [Oceanobacillus sp. M60]|uniref:DUF3923 domain-containing protein n=2 Tax=Oceanobacillus TaxID=182709 RepID=A0A0A1MCY1_9BACI|nr:DUF3923 family protein [Oceanobacillus oncorhynchi]CEI83220.1 hypothetical protein BN997_03124 [Oceanobacillus oncorhynchi]
MMKIWWTTSIVWILFFIAASVAIGVRDVDGAGVVQTPELRFLAFMVLGGFFVLVLIGQLIFLYFARKRKHPSLAKN